MREMSRKILVVLAGVVAIYGAGRAAADGMIIPRPNFYIDETAQKAVEWHDGKTETLIISPVFKGNAEEFAWVVPVPGKPEVKAGKDELFTSLEDYTRPKYPDRTPLPLMMGIGSSRVNESISNPVTVIESKQVDIYDIAVLEAQNGAALREWLVDNGFEYPANKDFLLQYYVNKNWYFVAAKVNTQALGYAEGSLREGHATPLSMTFLSSQIIYPLKISGPGSKFSEAQIPGAWGWEKGLAGWTGGTISTDEAWQGTKSLKHTNSGKAEAYYLSTYRMTGLKTGEQYVLSGYLKGASASFETAKLRVFGTGVEEESIAVYDTQISDWKRVSVAFIAGGESVTLSLKVDKMQPGSTVYWDGVQLERGSIPTAFEKETETMISQPVRNQANVQMVLYVLAQHKKYVPGFGTEFAGNVQPKVIEKWAYDDEGEPWMKASKKTYLTKLTRYMSVNEMTDDLVIREADDNSPVGESGTTLDSTVKIGLVLGVPLLAEALIVGYVWYSYKRKGRK